MNLRDAKGKHDRLYESKDDLLEMMSKNTFRDKNPKNQRFKWFSKTNEFQIKAE